MADNLSGHDIAGQLAEVAKPGLATRLTESDRQERATALRALLRTPLVSADGPAAEHFGLVRRHATWVREWVSVNTGWRLDITAEYARLRKTPAELDDSTRPARDPKSGQAFTKRRYVLLCLILAVLERADRQTTLGRLAETIIALAGSDDSLRAAGVTFEFRTADERRDLVHAVRLLVDLRVLIQQDGDEQAFMNSRGDVLYGIRRSCLAAMLSTPRSPSTIGADTLRDRVRLLTEEMAPDTDDARNQAARRSITRRLLDDPVVYRTDLNREEVAYLETQRPAIVRRIEEATGLIPEVRAEGIAMTDDRGDLTDISIPDEGTDGHVTLLVAEFLASAAREAPGEPVPVSRIAAHIAHVRGDYGSYWRRDAKVEGSELALAQEAVDRLCALKLVRIMPGGIGPLAAVGRYSLGEPRHATGSLWDAPI